MITSFLNLFRHLLSGKKPVSQQQTHTKQIVIEANMTHAQFAIELANCFVGVERPNKRCAEGVKIFDTPNTNLVSLAWGEMPHAVGFVGRYGKRTYAMALVQLPRGTYDHLLRMYNCIGQRDFNAHVGKHDLDMTPLNSWLPIAT